MNHSKAYAWLGPILGLTAALGLATLVAAQSETKSGDKAAKPSAFDLMKQAGQMAGVGQPSTPEETAADKAIEQQAESMEKSGKPTEEIKQWKAMMSVRVHPDSPTGLLALKDDLALTAEQVSQLQAIEEEAGQKAQALLTDSQKATFETLKFPPGTVMEKSMEMGKMTMRQMKEMKNKDKGKSALDQGMGLMGGTEKK
jgi:hypothetical protein